MLTTFQIRLLEMKIYAMITWYKGGIVSQAKQEDKCPPAVQGQKHVVGDVKIFVCKIL